MTNERKRGSDNTAGSSKRELRKRVAAKLGNDSISTGDSNRDRGNESGSSASPGASDGDTERNGTSESSFTKLRITNPNDKRTDGADSDSTNRSGIGDDRGSGESERNRSDGNGSDSRNATTIISNQADTNRNSKSVNFDEIFVSGSGERKRGRPRGSKKKRGIDYDIPGLEDLFKLAYSIPQVFGLGAHWELDEVEAQELKKAFLKVATNIDNRNFAKVLLLIEKLTPWGGLIICFYLITMPRIKLTSELLNESNRTEAKVYPSNQERPASSGDSWASEVDSKLQN